MLKRLHIELTPDIRRVVCLSFGTENRDAVLRIYKSVIALSPEDVQHTYENLNQEFLSRHINFLSMLKRTFQKIQKYLPIEYKLSETRQLLIASYFLKEYSVEAAALFNPSMIVHPNQDDPNRVKILMSLRATGEGHISSIEFVEGYIGKNGEVELLDRGLRCVLPQVTMAGVQKSIVEFDADTPLSEQVIFPLSEDESNGIEDVRFVRFEDNGKSKFYGTFTAYDGHNIKSKLISTPDFKKFTISSMAGSAVNDKGMALFPKKINNKYAMISRQDGENIRIMYSDDLLFWENSKVLQAPEFPWQFGKLGNCGSPIEVEEGWILLVHGVGPLRKYVMGAYLLDKINPEKIIARTKNYVLSAKGKEREGYVPNVVYSCGGICSNDILYIPFAISDISSGIVTINVKELIDSMDN